MMHREEERQPKVCPLLNASLPQSCVLTCKLGFRVMTDEQASEKSKNSHNILTHKCLVKETLFSIYKKFNKKDDNDGFEFVGTKKTGK